MHEMDHLDAILRKMAGAPVPIGLETVDRTVFARIAVSAATSVRAGFGAKTIGAALAIGVMGATVPTGAPGALNDLSPLGPVSPLAPSVLLVGE